MTEQNIKLSKKDEQFRTFALTDNPWKVVLFVGLPLALYQSLNQFFKILDSMMAAHIDVSSASTIAYLAQLGAIITALGNGLAIGSGLKISEAYGSGNFKLVQKRVNALFALTGLLGGFLLIFILPFTDRFLELAKTPEEFIILGRTYFIIELFCIVLNFFNTVYISIERARGNSKRILYLNLFVIAVKLSLTAIFIYLLKQGITMIAVASLISQSIITIGAIRNLVFRQHAFSLSFKAMRLDKKISWPLIRISLPVIIEKAAFSFGKAVINAMSTFYGALTVGALGISNDVTGMNVMTQNGIQDGAAAVISQNLGAGEVKRALETFKAAVFINLLLGICLLIPTWIFAPVITGIFAKSDGDFQVLLLSVFRYDLWSTVPLGLNAAMLALFYGFGKTKVTLFINFCRIFLFRIPVLWYLKTFTSLGGESVGIAMIISNSSVCLLSLLLSIGFIHKLCLKHHIRFF